MEQYKNRAILYDPPLFWAPRNCTLIFDNSQHPLLEFPLTHCLKKPQIKPLSSIYLKPASLLICLGHLLVLALQVCSSLSHSEFCTLLSGLPPAAFPHLLLSLFINITLIALFCSFPNSAFGVLKGGSKP